ADLHVAQCELIPRDAAREIVHQLFLAHSEALDDSPLLPLKRFAFEYLGNAAPQEIDSCLHVFFEWVGLPARKCQKAGPVGQFEIVDVAAVERFLGGRMKLLDHVSDGAAATGARQSANKDVVAGGGKLDAHLQGAQGALLP